MALRVHRTAWLLLATSLALCAGDIRGTIVVKRPLTRKNVTAPAGAYQRGVSVPLASNTTEDMFAYERQHVAVFLEGPGPITPQKVQISQKGRLFGPDLVAVPAGSSVAFP